MRYIWMKIYDSVIHLRINSKVFSSLTHKIYSWNCKWMALLFQIVHPSSIWLTEYKVIWSIEKNLSFVSTSNLYLWYKLCIFLNRSLHYHKTWFFTQLIWWRFFKSIFFSHLFIILFVQKQMKMFWWFRSINHLSTMCAYHCQLCL